jgi:hypothetical protein
MKKRIITEGKEALERTLLMMKYDMKKTLTENVEIILEQTVPCSSNPMSEDSVYDLANEMWDTLQNMQAIFIRMVSSGINGIENSKEIYQNISSLVNQTVIDDINGTCKIALTSFKDVYKERAKRGGALFSTEPDITKELEGLLKNSYFGETAGERGKKYISAAINILKTGSVAQTQTQTQTQNSDWSKTLMSSDIKNYKNQMSSISGVPALLVTYPNSKVYFAQNNRYFQYTPDGKTQTQKGSWTVNNGKLTKTPDGTKNNPVKKQQPPSITDKNLLNTLDFSYKYPGDNKYVYAFSSPENAIKEDTAQAGKWYAKNTSTGKVFDMTTNYPSTAAKLNANFFTSGKAEPAAPATPSAEKPAETKLTDINDIKGKGLKVEPVTQLKQPSNVNLQTNNNKTDLTNVQQPQVYDPYGPSNPQIKESLKKSLKKNLIEVKEKKEDLMVENKIIKNRFNFLFEGKSFETEEEKDYLVESVITEIGYLKTQGYSSQAINEGLFSMLGNIFGGSVKSIPAVFGEYIAGWLTKTLGIPQNSYMSSVVVALVGNLNIADYDKFFSDCRFSSNKIADSLIEGYVLQLQNEKNLNTGASGFIVSALRNSVVDYFTEDKTSLIQILEDKIGEFLCPKLSKLSSAISDKTDDLKSKIVA